MLQISPKQKTLLRWCTWFFAGNIILFWLIGLRYWPSINWLFKSEYIGILSLADRLALTGFLLFGFLAHLALLALLPYLLTVLLIIIFPKKTFIFTFAIILATLGVSLLLADSIVYNLFHFHLNGIILNIVMDATKSGESFLNLSYPEIGICIGLFLCVILVEYLWAFLLEKRIFDWYQKRLYQNLNLCFFLFIILSAIISYSIYIPATLALYRAGEYADRGFSHALLEASRILPFFNKILAAFIPGKNGQISLERIFEHKFVQPSQAQETLHYPLKPLKFITPKKPLNLMIIIVDAWRFDMLDPVVTPNLYQFSKKAWVFNQHFSGGNSTGPGIFSIFYSLPASYWTAMKEQHKSPILMDRLSEQNYQMNILASSGLRFPDLKSTIFQAIPTPETSPPGKDSSEQDESITQSFQDFIVQYSAQNKTQTQKQTQKPFFSFLYYVSSQAYCKIDNKNVLEPFTPAVKNCNRLTLHKESDPIPYFNRYKNALHFIDKKLGQVFESLKTHQLLENTVVIITGDHGEEFNDNHLGYFGHTSNFTRYQVQTPLIVYWPGEKPHSFNHMTSHFDIAPTLMEKLLGSQSEVKDYSIGTSLLDNHVRPYLIVGSYIGLGVIEKDKDRLITIYPTGEYQITHGNAEPQENAELPMDIIREMIQALRRFYQ
jgi:hypothetical protein